MSDEIEEDDFDNTTEETPSKNSLLKRLQGATSKKVKTKTLGQTDYFDINKYGASTGIHSLDLAVSGKIVDGGICPGIHIIAGPSKSFKTILCLLYLRGYMEKFPDAVCVFYDTEFGGPKYFESLGIDQDRVLHVPVGNVEFFKQDVMKKLKEIDEKDHTIFFLDSLGMMPSIKELNDAEDEKIVADMSRAKGIKSAMRMMTPTLAEKKIPFLMVNHTIASMDKYKIDEMSGGRGPMYSATTVIYMGKAKIKEETEDSVNGLGGHRFTMKLVKSRFAKEGASIPLDVRYGSPEPDKYSGLYELALQTDDIFSPARGWRAYQVVDKETGELLPQSECPKFREKEMKDNPEEIWTKIFEETNFIKNVENLLSL